MSKRAPSFAIAAAITIAPPASVAALPVAEVNRGTPVEFASEVYPALRRNCLACHNATKAKANLNLESPALMLEGGDSGPAVVPGDASASLVFLSAAHLDEPEMPPAKNNSKAKDLSPDELGLLRRWIDEGAAGESPVGSDRPIEWREAPPSARTPAPVYEVALTREGTIAAAARGRTASVYNLATTRKEADLTDPAVPGGATHRDFVQSMAFAPDGRLLTGGFREVKVWARTQRPTERPPGPAVSTGLGSGAAAAVLVQPELTLIGGADGRVRVVPGDGSPVATLDGHSGEVLLASAGHGVAATADATGRVIVWSLAEHKEQARAELGSRPVGLAVAPDGGRFATLAEGSPVPVLWTATGERVGDLDASAGFRWQQAFARQRAQTQESLANERRLQSEAADKTQAEQLKARDASSAAAEAARAAHTEATKSGEGDEEARAKAVAEAEKKLVAAERDLEVAGRLLTEADAAKARTTAALERETARLSELRSAADSLTEPPPPQWRLLAFTADGGAVVAAAADGTAAVFGASDGRLAGPLEAQAGWGAFLGLSRSGDRVFERALAPAEPAWVLERRIDGFPDRVTALDVSPDGRWLAVGSGEPSRNGFVGVWDLGSGQPRWSLPDAHSDSVLAVAVSPDGTRVASGGADRMVRVFSATDGELLAALEGHAGYATALDWRADGLRLASAGTDNSVRLWDPEGARQVEARDGFRKPVASLAFAGDGSQIVAASGDPALRFEAEPLFTGGDYLHSVAVCALGRTAVAGSQDGTLRIWSLNEKRLLAEFGPAPVDSH